MSSFFKNLFFKLYVTKVKYELPSSNRTKKQINKQSYHLNIYLHVHEVSRSKESDRESSRSEGNRMIPFIRAEGNFIQHAQQIGICHVLYFAVLELLLTFLLFAADVSPPACNSVQSVRLSIVFERVQSLQLKRTQANRQNSVAKQKKLRHHSFDNMCTTKCHNTVR